MNWSYWQFLLAILFLSNLARKEIMFSYIWLVCYYIVYDWYQVDNIGLDLIVCLLFYFVDGFKTIVTIIIINSLCMICLHYFPNEAYILTDHNKLFYIDLIFWTALKEIEFKKLSITNQMQLFVLYYLYFIKGFL